MIFWEIRNKIRKNHVGFKRPLESLILDIRLFILYIIVDRHNCILEDFTPFEWRFFDKHFNKEGDL